MKKFLSVFLLMSLVFTGCSGGGVDQSQNQPEPSSKMKIVTSFYPLYEIARRVGGEHADVQNLVPPGAEPHDYELTPKEISEVYAADILVVNGFGIEPWLEKLLPELGKSGVKIVNVSTLFGELIARPEGEKGDPHFWLDPSRYIREVSAVQLAFSEADPANRDYYEANAKSFTGELEELDREFSAGLSNCSTRSFVTNHAAFGYLAQRYQLQMVSIAGLSPEAEPSARDLADLTDLLREKSTKYVLVETLVSPKIGETLAREVGAQTLVLNPLEGLDAGEIREGKNYVSVMRENLKNLQIAMDCR
jgi:zinc transport system substrate-binding protein